MLRQFLRVAPLCALFVLPLLHAEDLFFDSDGVRLHYTVQGAGEPVLLIHGYTANIAINWAAPGVIKALADNYQVIALDMRGHGQSAKPHDPSMYGHQMVEDAIRLMDHLNLSKVHVVGYSMGGFITSALITEHPDRFMTATMGGAGFGAPANDAMLTQLAESLEQGEGIGPLIIALTPPGQEPMPPQQIEATNKMLLSFNDPLALAAVARGGLPQVSEAKIRANKVPTLALIGELDPLKAGVDQLQAMMPHLKVVVIPGATHLTAFASPVFIENLKSFLAEHPAKPKASTATAGN
jgi:pimeloyl-ACP methyl ester carboxylesterase